MGELQRLMREDHPYWDIEGQEWYQEIVETGRTYDIHREGNRIKFHIKDYTPQTWNKVENDSIMLKLKERNISCNYGCDYAVFIIVSYDFKNRKPRRSNSRKEVRY